MYVCIVKMRRWGNIYWSEDLGMLCLFFEGERGLLLYSFYTVEGRDNYGGNESF